MRTQLSFGANLIFFLQLFKKRFFFLSSYIRIIVVNNNSHKDSCLPAIRTDCIYAVVCVYLYIYIFFTNVYACLCAHGRFKSTTKLIYFEPADQNNESYNSCMRIRTVYRDRHVFPVHRQLVGRGGGEEIVFSKICTFSFDVDKRLLGQCAVYDRKKLVLYVFYTSLGIIQYDCTHVDSNLERFFHFLPYMTTEYHVKYPQYILQVLQCTV